MFYYSREIIFFQHFHPRLRQAPGRIPVPEERSVPCRQAKPSGKHEASGNESENFGKTTGLSFYLHTLGLRQWDDPGMQDGRGSDGDAL